MQLRTFIYSHRAWRRLVCVVAAVALGAILGCSKPAPPPVRGVVLISIDTCRADYLSCYGYPRKTTPNLDAIAEEGILFRNVLSPVPITLPAHASMLTGTIPPYHGVHDNHDYRLGISDKTLAEVFQEHGYETAAVVGSVALDAKFRLDQGFDFYEDDIFDPSHGFASAERNAGEVSRLAKEWLENRRQSDPFFLFLHYYDPHAEYSPPEPFSLTYADNLYAGEIAYTDQCIGQVVDTLKRLGLYDSTLLVITGDHGESLGEHGEDTHMYFIYQSALKVPLIFKLPRGVAGRKVGDFVALIDVMPTLLSYLGMALPEQVQGEDLSGYFSPKEKAAGERYIFCESLTPTKYGCSPLLGMVNPPWKYIHTTRPELYDLGRDPGEAVNQAEKESRQAHRLKDHLEEILAQRRPSEAEEDSFTLDAQTRQQLQALGYVGGRSVQEDFDLKQDKDDPKDLIHVHSKMTKAIGSVQDKQFQQAKRLSLEVVAGWPDVVDAHIVLGTIAYEEDDLDSANAHYSRAIALVPENEQAHFGLGKVYERQGKFEQAVAQYSEALKIVPDSAMAQHHLGFALVRMGKLEEALPHYREAIRLRVAFPQAHNSLGVALEKLGKLDEATQHYTEAARIDPSFADAHLNLGTLLGRQGNFEESASHLTEAVRLEPDDPDAHYNLASTLLALGRTRSAIEEYEEAFRLRLGWPWPANELAWILATHPDEEFRDPERAVQLAQAACENTDFRHPVFLDTYAAASAAVEQFEDAVRTAERAIRLARSAGQEDLAGQIESRLRLYETGRPFVAEAQPTPQP